MSHLWTWWAFEIISKRLTSHFHTILCTRLKALQPNSSTNQLLHCIAEILLHKTYRVTPWVYELKQHDLTLSHFENIPVLENLL